MAAATTPSPSLVPRVTVERAGLGAAGRGVEDGHAAAAGADDVGDEGGAVATDVAQDGALGVDVRELLFHPAPGRGLQRAAAPDTPISTHPGRRRGRRRKGEEGLTGRSLCAAAAGLWPAASSGGSRSPARRRGCEPVSWKASSSAGCAGVSAGWGRGRDSDGTGLGRDGNGTGLGQEQRWGEGWDRDRDEAEMGQEPCQGQG